MENWKPIEGYEGLYEISDQGRVKSLRSQLIMRQDLGNSGYGRVQLSKDGYKRRYLVHRLVAFAFCSGYKEGLEVNHVDGNRLNNAAKNLEWVTRSMNTLDTVRRGTFPYENFRKAQAVATANRMRKVEQLDKQGNFIARFNSQAEASRATGAQQTKISEACRGKRHTAGGYKWRFAD